VILARWSRKQKCRKLPLLHLPRRGEEQRRGLVLPLQAAFRQIVSDHQKFTPAAKIFKRCAANSTLLFTFCASTGVFCGGFSLTPESHAADTKLTIAMLRSATQTPYYVAAEAGFYKNYGLNVLPVQFSGGTQGIMALVAGDVQINTSGGPAAINARLKGGNVILVGTNVGVFPYILYTAGGINKAEDLKGKRVGVSGLGGVTHFAMIYALKKLGLNPETDATMTVIGSPVHGSPLWSAERLRRLWSSRRNR
jgi:ABC-type nitrate/sulfonate/bicarbonate transport system substrate-binding protein